MKVKSKHHTTAKSSPELLAWIVQHPHYSTYLSHDRKMVYITGPTHRISHPVEWQQGLLPYMKATPEGVPYLYELTEAGQKILDEWKLLQTKVEVKIGTPTDNAIREALSKKQQVHDNVLGQLRQRSIILKDGKQIHLPVHAEGYLHVHEFEDGTSKLLPVCSIIDAHGNILITGLNVVFGNYLIDLINNDHKG